MRLSAVHAKPSTMNRALSFFVSIGFLIYSGLTLSHPLTAASPAPQIWVATWSTSQQIPEPQNELPLEDLHDATVRQIFHLSIGGSALRVHVSNAFGTEALRFTSVHIARPLSTSSPAIDPASDQPLAFAGKPGILVPPSAEFISDPVHLNVAPLSDIAVTFHLDDPPSRESSHPGSQRPPTTSMATLRARQHFSIPSTSITGSRFQRLMYWSHQKQEP